MAGDILVGVEPPGELPPPPPPPAPLDNPPSKNTSSSSSRDSPSRPNSSLPPIVRYSATQVTTSLYAEWAGLPFETIPLPSTLLSFSSTPAPRGSKVGRESGHKFAVALYHSQLTHHAGPHPQGALHIYELTDFFTKYKISKNEALKMWTDTFTHGEAEPRHGLRELKNIYVIFGPQGVEGRSSIALCGAIQCCEFMSGRDQSIIRAEQERGQDGLQGYAGAFRASVERACAESIIARTVVSPMSGRRVPNARTHESPETLKTDAAYSKIKVSFSGSIVLELTLPLMQSRSGEKYLGCSTSDWYDMPSSHRHLPLPDVDVPLFERLLAGGVLTADEALSSGLPQDSCTFFTNSSSKIERCPFPHVRHDGLPVYGEVIQQACSTVTQRYTSETMPYRYGILRRGVCSHPIPSPQLSISARINICMTADAIERSGGDPTTTRVKNVVNLTDASGLQLGLGHGGITNQNIQAVLTVKAKVQNPEGQGWEGLIDRCLKEELGPIQNRYIHFVRSCPGIVSRGVELKFAILFDCSMIESLHVDGGHVQMDTTFPFRRGKECNLKEWKWGAMGITTRQFRTFFRVLMNVHSEEAFLFVFETAAPLIKNVTGREWDFGMLSRERVYGLSPTLTVSADMEAAPILALGKYLQKRLALVDRSTASASIDALSPDVWPPSLDIVIGSFLIVCNVHWKRTILPLVHEIKHAMDSQTKRILAPLLAIAAKVAKGQRVDLPTLEDFDAYEAELSSLSDRLSRDLRRIWGFSRLESMDEINEFWEYFGKHPIPAILNWARHKIMHRWISGGVNPFASLIDRDVRKLASPSGGTNALEGSHHMEDCHTKSYKRLMRFVDGRRQYDKLKSQQFETLRVLGQSSQGPGQSGPMASITANYSRQQHKYNEKIKRKVNENADAEIAADRGENVAPSVQQLYTEHSTRLDDPAPPKRAKTRPQASRTPASRAPHYQKKALLPSKTACKLFFTRFDTTRSSH
ncbi:hypothetical protein JCM5353_003805 [Sporobolomyces roseus]